MLRFNAVERYTIQKIRNHSWFISSPINTGDAIPVPPLKGDSLRSSTVLPYLESYHYENRQNHSAFFTEHDLNGEFSTEWYLPGYCILNYFSWRTGAVVVIISTNQQKAKYYQSRHHLNGAAGRDEQEATSKEEIRIVCERQEADALSSVLNPFS